MHVPSAAAAIWFWRLGCPAGGSNTAPLPPSSPSLAPLGVHSRTATGCNRLPGPERIEHPCLASTSPPLTCPPVALPPAPSSCPVMPPHHVRPPQNKRGILACALRFTLLLRHIPHPSSPRLCAYLSLALPGPLLLLPSRPGLQCGVPVSARPIPFSASLARTSRGITDRDGIRDAIISTLAPAASSPSLSAVAGNYPRGLPLPLPLPRRPVDARTLEVA